MRRSKASIDDHVRERLRQLTEQWTPVDVPLMEAPEHEPPHRWQLTFDGRAWRALIAIVVALALVGGWTWWQGRPRSVLVADGPAMTASQMPSAAGEVVVHVVGAVRRPGLVHLPVGSRVADAVDAVGGAKNEQALATVNLARVLVDGEQIDVGATSAAKDDGISLNNATAAQFEELPGIGPVLAERIVDWRTKHGPFRSIDDLGDVSGIGDSVLEQVRDLVHL